MRRRIAHATAIVTLAVAGGAVLVAGPAGAALPTAGTPTTTSAVPTSSTWTPENCERAADLIDYFWGQIRRTNDSVKIDYYVKIANSLGDAYFGHGCAEMAAGSAT